MKYNKMTDLAGRLLGWVLRDVGLILSFFTSSFCPWINDQRKPQPEILHLEEVGLGCV